MPSVIERLKAEGCLHLLSAFFRRLQPNTDNPVVMPGNVDDLLNAMPAPHTMAEKLDGLLKILAARTPTPGEEVKFEVSTDYPLVFAANVREGEFLIENLTERGFLKPPGGLTANWSLTADGYERLEELEARSYTSTRNAFVAMSFAKERDFIYNDAIEPAIREAGYRAIRVDKSGSCESD